ncbi:MAG: RdgB/HAM1 family non-canonical purine NTP pyrophosphatase [Prevotellaceae bacterium]|nr:RdgB/HAM1 family non-canonical purine NTP pyrophosphatase [Prevotellaceae bacterium]
MRQLVMATNNPQKLIEARRILGEGFQVLGLADICCHDDIPETSLTLQGNALLKARHVWDRYGVDCFADDTGLEVDALLGEPGVFTARYGSLYGYGVEHDPDANIRCLLCKLKEVKDRSARFRTVIALIQGGETAPYSLFEGVVEGSITSEPRGLHGFGYDPVFQPNGSRLTFAEMGAEQKNRISHRAIAMRKMMEFLRR